MCRRNPYELRVDEVKHLLWQDDLRLSFILRKASIPKKGLIHCPTILRAPLMVFKMRHQELHDT